MVNIFFILSCINSFQGRESFFFFLFSCYDIYVISVDSLARLHLSQVEKYIYFRWKKKMGRNYKGVRATTERKAELWFPFCLMESLEFSRGKCIGAVGCFIPGLTGILGALWLVKGHFSYLGLSAIEGDSSQGKKNKYLWVEISF